MTNDSLFSFFRVAETRVKLKLVSYLSMAILAVAAAATSIVFILGAKHFIERNKVKKEATDTHAIERIGIVRAEQEYSLTYEIKDMSIGFINRTGTRTAYAQFTILFDCETELCVKNLTLNRAKLLDAIYQVSGNYYIEDFVAPLVDEGMKRFKLALLEHIKKNLGGEAPRKIVFRDWFLN